VNVIRNTIEIDLPAPKGGLVSPHRPACWLWGNGRRYSGTLEESEDGGAWTFRSAEPLRGDLSSARRLELELCADSGAHRQLGLPRFQVFDFEVDAAAGRVRLRPVPFQEEQAHLFRVQEDVAVAVTGESISGRTLVGAVGALTPYEVLATVADHEHLLFPGAVVKLEVARPWRAFFNLQGRVAAVERREAVTRIYVRLVDRQSIEEAGLLAACECPGFGTHTLWTYKLPIGGIEKLVRVHQAVTTGDMVKVLELRRDANHFHGQRPEVNDWRAWSDPLDETSVVILASLGTKPVATGRLVVNGGDRSRSEIESAVRLPDFLWVDSFVEASKLAIRPGFRGAGLRLPLFREMVRAALALESRYIVFETIPPLVPDFETMGADHLHLTKPHPDTGTTAHVMVLDLSKALAGRAIGGHAVFGPALADFRSVYGQGGLARLSGDGGRRSSH
jgi:hypothetical protein